MKSRIITKICCLFSKTVSNKLDNKTVGLHRDEPPAWELRIWFSISLFSTPWQNLGLTIFEHIFLNIADFLKMSWSVWHVRGHLCVPFGVSSFSLELSAAFWGRPYLSGPKKRLSVGPWSHLCSKSTSPSVPLLEHQNTYIFSSQNMLEIRRKNLTHLLSAKIFLKKSSWIPGSFNFCWRDQGSALGSQSQSQIFEI